MRISQLILKLFIDHSFFIDSLMRDDLSVDGSINDDLPFDDAFVIDVARQLMMKFFVDHGLSFDGPSVDHEPLH